MDLRPVVLEGNNTFLLGRLPLDFSVQTRKTLISPHLPPGPVPPRVVRIVQASDQVVADSSLLLPGQLGIRGLDGWKVCKEAIDDGAYCEVDVLTLRMLLLRKDADTGRRC